MAHVELSLSELMEPGSDGIATARSSGSLSLWAFTVEVAREPCLVADHDGVVVAASAGCAVLLGIDPAGAVGRRLVGGVLRLLDFSPVAGELPAWEADKIPPILSLTSGGLARGLLRLPAQGGAAITIDAISVPLRDGPDVVGSLTFFAPVGR